MAEKKIAQKGKKLKDFKLKDQNGQDFHLTEYKGKKVCCPFIRWLGRPSPPSR